MILVISGRVKFVLKNTKQHKLSLPAPLAYLFIGPSERIQRLNQRIFRRLSIRHASICLCKKSEQRLNTKEALLNEELPT